LASACAETCRGDVADQRALSKAITCASGDGLFAFSGGKMRALAIETERLARTYKPRKNNKDEAKERIALSDVTLTVPRGELFGLLGPNGAGKTTLIKILTTLLAPSSGWAAVEGYDVHLEPQFVRPCINMVSGGEASGYGLLTVRENLWMFRAVLWLSSADANRRIVEQ
jgi:ABC-2 type transport system ATP-binding protein